MTSERDDVPRSVLRAYERGRAKLALIGALPALLYGACACLASAASESAAPVGLALAMFGFAALGIHLGRPYARGVGLGLLLAAIPFGVATFAQSRGHMCLDGACMAVCLPACTCAGVATGVLGSWLLVRANGGLHSLVSMATIVTIGGALGCHCVGYGSVGGLIAGFVIASVPAMPRLIAAGRAGA